MDRRYRAIALREDADPSRPMYEVGDLVRVRGPRSRVAVVREVSPASRRNGHPNSYSVQYRRPNAGTGAWFYCENFELIAAGPARDYPIEYEEGEQGNLTRVDYLD